MTIVWIFSIVALGGVALTTVEAVQTWRFTRHRKNRRPFVDGLHEQAGPGESEQQQNVSQRVGFTPTALPCSTSSSVSLNDEKRDRSKPVHPRLSILKPLCGLDDELRENLISFTRLEGISYEVILSVADPHDPAVNVVQSVQQEFPDAPFTLVIGASQQCDVRNPKIARLIAASERARGEILLISDSNVRVDPDFAALTLKAFDDPRVGCASNLFTGEGARTLGARLEALHLLTFVVAGNVLAHTFEAPCVVGKSMAIRRSVLEELGGFDAFGHVLAEDQAIGVAVDRAGYGVTLSPVVVRNVIVDRTVGRAMNRQIRWNKIRYSFSKSLYAGEFLLNPLPLSILSVLAGMTVAPEIAARQILLGAAVATLRMLQTVLLSSAAESRMAARTLLLVPLQDLLQFAAQFVPFFSREVSWHGHRARLGRGTVMILEGDEVLSAA